MKRVIDNGFFVTLLLILVCSAMVTQSTWIPGCHTADSTGNEIEEVFCNPSKSTNGKSCISSKDHTKIREVMEPIFHEPALIVLNKSPVKPNMTEQLNSIFEELHLNAMSGRSGFFPARGFAKCTLL